MIWFATYKIGVAFTGQHPSRNPDGNVLPAEFHLGFNAEIGSGFWRTLGDTFWPMVIGALPLGLLCAAACYLLVHASLQAIRRRASSFSRSLGPRAP